MFSAGVLFHKACLLSEFTKMKPYNYYFSKNDGSTVLLILLCQLLNSMHLGHILHVDLPCPGLDFDKCFLRSTYTFQLGSCIL